MAERWGWDIYVVRARGTDRYKIGKARLFEKRLPLLQTGCPFQIDPITIFRGDESLEKDLHKLWAKYRVCGEWFELPENVVKFIKNSDESDLSRLLTAEYLLSKRLEAAEDLPFSKVDEIRSSAREVIRGFGL